jgi:glycosyltransferase involved in cell wall biosynthesis
MSNKYYKLIINFNGGVRYRSMTLDIPGFPRIEVPNIIFTKLMEANSVDELEKIKMNTIYFYGQPPKSTDAFGRYQLSEISKDEFIKNVSLYALRRLMDLRLIKYYMALNVIPINDNFIDRFNGHYSFYTDPAILDKTFSVGGSKRQIKKGSPTVLYCIFFSPQYEHIGYTLRTHSLLKSTHDAGVNIIGVSRYGYPYDKPKEYYINIGIDDYQKDGVKYIKLLDGVDNFNDNNIVEYIKKYTRRLVEVAKEYDADIIHAASNWFNGLAAYYAAKLLGIPSIYEVRGFWDESSIAMRPELHEADMIKMKQLMENFVVSRVNRVITINDNLKAEMLERVPDLKDSDVDVICNGVDVDKFNVDSHVKADMRKKYGLSDDIIVFGYIGSLLNYEGIEYIMHALRRLSDDGYKPKFFMIGDGKEKDNLLKLADKLRLQDSFQYIGKIDHDDVSKFYNMFDIVVYPRKNDKVCRTTSSSKIFETMCMAKAIVVSRLPAYDEIITDRYNGLYCTPDDQDDIYHKMKELIDDEELRVTIGDNAREWVIKNRDWNALGVKLSGIYKQCLDDFQTMAV